MQVDYTRRNVIQLMVKIESEINEATNELNAAEIMLLD